MRLASSLSFSTGSATLSRSLSSAGERHSEAYVPPALCVPRRAETFAGFDHNKVSKVETRVKNIICMMVLDKEFEICYLLYGSIKIVTMNTFFVA